MLRGICAIRSQTLLLMEGAHAHFLINVPIQESAGEVTT